MSPKATRIEEEGIYIDPFKLVEGGRFREDAVLTLLTQGPYPARDPAQNIADLKAQAAANAKGVDELGKMVAQYGLDVVQAYMGHVQDNAAASVARVIERARTRRASRSRPTPARASKSRSTSTARAARPSSISPARARNSPTPSMRLSRSRGLACSMSSARWSMTTFRSTQAACGISRSSCRKDRCSSPATPPRSPPAMSRRARPS